MRTTKEVWEHHCIALDSANIGDVMFDFAVDAIYVTAKKVIKGKENIMKLIKAIFFPTHRNSLL